MLWSKHQKASLKMDFIVLISIFSMQFPKLFYIIYRKIVETCENETFLNNSESHKYTVVQMVNIIKARITDGKNVYT